MPLFTVLYRFQQLAYFCFRPGVGVVVPENITLGTLQMVIQFAMGSGASKAKKKLKLSVAAPKKAELMDKPRRMH